MKYVELTVTTTNACEDLVSDVFWAYTDYGVAISSVLDVAKILQGEVIYDYFDEEILNGAQGISLVKGYFLTEEADEKINKVRCELEALKQNCVFDTGSLETVKRIVDGDDWVQIWKKHFKPVRFDKITICPEWISADGLDGIVVKINSDMAFGTGEHETTAMILDVMQQYIDGDCSVLDVGTGSGILGISASLLGAKKIVMTDIDETACEVARKNVALNNVENCTVYCQGDLNNIAESFDVVVANITAEVLSVLSKDMSATLKSGGIMILSGILNDRIDKVEKAFSAFDMAVESVKSQGEWSCLVMLKK